MAQLLKTANTEDNNETVDSSFSPIPKGKYPGQLTESEWVDNKSGMGRHVALKFELTEGDYKGRLAFDRLNLDNPSSKAEMIANKTLNSICKACDKSGVKDTEELHMIPILLDIDVDEYTNGHGEISKTNRIVKYSKLDGWSESQTAPDDEVPF